MNPRGDYMHLLNLLVAVTILFCISTGGCAPRGAARAEHDDRIALYRIGIKQTEQADKDYFVCQAALQALNIEAEREHTGIINFLNPKQRQEFLTTDNQPWDAVIPAVSNDPSLVQRMSAVWRDALNQVRVLYTGYMKAHPNKLYDELQSNPTAMLAQGTEMTDIATALIYTSLESTSVMSPIEIPTALDGLRACASLARVPEPKTEIELLAHCHVYSCPAEMDPAVQNAILTVEDRLIHNGLFKEQMEGLSSLYPSIGSTHR